jgi:Non-ribosomal peptide synthetase modules and related proteins
MVQRRVAARTWRCIRVFCSRGDARLPNPPIQYADFATWQREHLNSEVIDGHLAYWRRQLEGVPMIMDLPTDGSREVKGTRRRAQRRLRLSQETTMALRALGQDQNCTLFITLMAAFQVLLHRHTGQESISGWRSVCGSIEQRGGECDWLLCQHSAHQGGFLD